MLPAAAVRDRALGRCSPLHVLAWLCKYRNTKTGECYPSVETMAADLGIEARSVQRHMEALIDCGHVVVIPRVNRSTGKQTSNLYYVLYGDVPPPADREVAPKEAQEADDAREPSDGAVMASGDGVTSSVTHAPLGVTPNVTPEPEIEPGRGDTECRGGVTSSVARGDAECHPNYPTASIPLNEPSAEAARSRARDAAAEHEGGGKIETGKASTGTQLPPRLASHLRVLAKTTGKTEAAFVAVIAEWSGGLIDRGIDAALALDRIAFEARRIPATGYAWEALTEAMTKDLSKLQPMEKAMGAAA